LDPSLHNGLATRNGTISTTMVVQRWKLLFTATLENPIHVNQPSSF
jgi:hypothetical protein